MKKITIPLAALLVVGLTGCPGGATIHTDYDHQVNFSQFHTFSFGHTATDNPLNQTRIRDEVTKDFSAKGLRMVESGGDLVVTAVGSTRDKQEYTTFYNQPAFGYYYGGFGGLRAPGYSTTSVQNYKVGTLILDMYNAESKQLVWRSIAKRGISDSSDAKRAELNTAVDKMLGDFPPS